MKNVLSVIIAFIFSFNLICAQEKSELENNTGKYESLEKALKEPEKVISYFADKTKNIPVSVSDFKNLQTLSLFLRNVDKFPDGLMQLKNLKRLTVFSDAKQDWQTLFCGLDSLESFTLLAPLSEEEMAEIRKCVHARVVTVWTSYSKEETKKMNKANFNNVAEAIASEVPVKTLSLYDAKEINRISEIKDLQKIYFFGWKNKKVYDFSACSGSTTAVLFETYCIEGGRITGLDVGKFPNLEELMLTAPYSTNMKELPPGIEKLTMLKKLTLYGVEYSEEKVDELKKMLPLAKITLNNIVIQNPGRK